MARRVVGVIGGMGPAATVHFMGRVLALTPAARDQDHVRLIVDNNGGVLDRNAAVRGQGPSPGPELANMARGLERAGAEVLVMPCNTAHAFAAAVREATPLPFIDLIDVACDEALAKGAAHRLGVLEADGCRQASLYPRALARRGAEAVLLSPGDQAAFMRLLHRIKGGEVGPEIRGAMQSLAHRLLAAGAEAIIAGCTEVPLVLGPRDLDAVLIDSVDALARATIHAGGAG